MNSIKVDKKFIGVPFLWEGRSLKGTDCAGMVSLFLEEHGIEIIDSAVDSYRWKQDPQKLLHILNKVAKKIPPTISKLKPGDILCFRVQGLVRHVGVYIGYGKFLHVMQLNRSCVSTIDNFWKFCLVGAIRPSEKDDGRVKPFDLEDEVGFVYTALVALGFAYAAYIAVGIYIMVFAAAAFYMASSVPKANFGMGGGAVDGSPRYSTFGALQSTASSDLVVPVLYGELKLAGNAVYQSDPATEVTRCDVFCVGEINSISDIRVNDVPIGELDGCSVTSYTGTASQTTDTRFTGSGGRLVPGLRNAAYLALTLKTGPKLNGGFPAVTAILQGQKVQTWDGTQWTSAKTYSNNPAACVRDFILSSRYGVGVPASLLDESSFGEVYDYCEALVDNNEGGTEKRYNLNYILDSRKPAPDCLSDMLGSFSGWIVWSGNRLKLKVEKAESVIQSFTMDDIVEKSFSYKWSDKDDTINRIKVQYVDPDQNYTKVFCIAEDKAIQDSREAIEGSEGVVEKELSLLGITRFSQASRIASQVLKGIKASPISCAFKAGIKAIHCEPGDVITVSHDVPAWINKLFRVAGIQEDENDEMTITCREYNDSVYTDSYGSSITTYQYGTPVNVLKNDAEVTGIVLTEIGWRNEDGTHIASIDVSWAASSIKDYLTTQFVEWNKDGAGYVFTAQVGGDSTSVRLPNAEVGSSYTVRIKTQNYYGIVSNGAVSGSLTIVGKDANPPNVQNFIANQYRDSLVFSWDKITSIPDISYYEIKQGVSWEVGTVTGSLLKNNTWTYGNIRNGTWTFWIKAVDNSGNYSVSANAASVTVVSIPFQNIIFNQDEHTAWTGTKTNLSVVGDNLEIDAGYASGDYLTDWINVGKLVTARIGFGYTVTTSGDLAFDSDASLAFDTYSNLRWTGFDAPQSLNLFVQVSGDSGASGDFTPWQFSDYYYRYFRVKAVLQREDVSLATRLSTLTESSDIPDVDTWGPTDGTYRFCPASGDNVTFDKTFYYAPEVAIMVYPSGDGKLRTPEVSSSTTGFNVRLRDKTDTAIQGNYRYHAHGF